MLRPGPRGRFPAAAATSGFFGPVPVHPHLASETARVSGRRFIFVVYPSAFVEKALRVIDSTIARAEAASEDVRHFREFTIKKQLYAGNRTYTHSLWPDAPGEEEAGASL
jgi:hypothetical protein